MQLIAIFM